MREPTKLLLPSFTVIALRSPPAGPAEAQAARGAANNIKAEEVTDISTHQHSG